MRAVLDPIVASLKANGEHPSQGRVVKFFAHTDDERQLRRWVSSLLHLTWDEYLDTVTVGP